MSLDHTARAVADVQRRLARGWPGRNGGLMTTISSHTPQDTA
jgi:hypothetical protein